MADLPVPSGPILVVGDIMCDHYVWGDVERISPEAPVQVVRWEREADRAGGAANAAMNLAALGCRVSLIGLVGRDRPGEWLMDTLRSHRIDVAGVVRVRDRGTTLKTRVVARGQHVLRIDRESRDLIHRDVERRLIAAVKQRLQSAAAILCSDYDKGALTRPVLDAVLRTRRPGFTVVDPKGADFGKYRGADLLTPNEKELAEAVGSSSRIDTDAGVAERAARLMKRERLPALLVTRGAAGMDLFERRGRTTQRTHIPPLQRHEVFDVTGAGDTVAAVLTYATACGLPLDEAARLANAAAGIVVGMAGTSIVDRETLAGIVGGESTQARSKVLPPSVIAARLGDARARGLRVVFTSGSFDALNVADLRVLQQARARGELLVVGIRADGTSAQQRAELLAALRVVDYVTLYRERTAAPLIRLIKPDVVIPPS